METLHQEGLYTAIVTPETVPHPETHQMDVIFHVKPGPRARVGTVNLKNETEYPDSETVEAAQNERRPGDYFRAAAERYRPHPKISGEKRGPAGARRGAARRVRHGKKHHAAGPGSSAGAASQIDGERGEIFEGRIAKAGARLPGRRSGRGPS